MVLQRVDVERVRLNLVTTLAQRLGDSPLHACFLTAQGRRAHDLLKKGDLFFSKFASTANLIASMASLERDEGMAVRGNGEGQGD
ncbi:hypothetical protein QW131_03160 [Roseibium salinum]|nr:hypothetical protein [Roseibium salinum]